ncbi:MAG: PEP-utilizing enzyme [Acidimicrobiales bacterium]
MSERWIVDNEPSRRHPIYTRGNVGEVFPDPVAPLSWTLAGIPGSEQGWREAFVRFGVFDHEEFDPHEIEILGVFYGYAYLNVSVSRIFGVRVPGLTPELVDYTLFGEQSDAPSYQPRPDDESPEHSERVAATLGWIMSAPEQTQLIGDQRAMEELRRNRPDLATLSERELVDRTRDLMGTWFRELFANHLFTSYCSMVPTGVVSTVSQALGDPSLAMRLVAGLGGVDSAAPSWAMWKLGRMAAESKDLSAAFDAGVAGLLGRLRATDAPEAADFLTALDQFLYEFGSRGPNEWEMRSPTWETNPELALTAIDRMRLSPPDAAPQGHQDALIQDREELTAKVAEMLDGDPDTQGQFLAAMRAAAVFLPARERSKTNIVRLVNECRVMMHEFGRRMVAAGHFDAVENFGMLKADELDAFLEDPESFKQTIRQREKRWAELARKVPPFVIHDGLVPPEQWPAVGGGHVEAMATGTVLSGIPGCPGKASGRARIILDPSDGGMLQPGEVLVAPITDPSWTPLFVPSAAVVVNVGAQISHAIIVSRELGIPCVVSVTEATRRIREGSLIEVDGTAGTVTILELPED